MYKHRTLNLHEIILQIFIGYSHKKIDPTPINFFLDTNIPEGCNYILIKDKCLGTVFNCKLIEDSKTIVSSQQNLRQHFSSSGLTDNCNIYLNYQQEKTLQRLISLI